MEETIPGASATSVLAANEYRLLVEHSPVMIWRAGLDAKCDYFNERWLAFTGRTIEQELGNGWIEGVHPDDLDRCVEYYLDHFHRRVEFEMEYRLRRNDGVYRWILDRGAPFQGVSGVFAGFIGSCVDVDDRRRAQEARERRDAKEIALAREFEQRVLTIVSHDIRNPLAVIQLAARHMRQSASEATVVEQDADRVLRSVARIQNIVADLLDLSREREGTGIAISLQETDISTICKQIVDELETTAHDHKIIFDCATDGRGWWDHNRVIQAVSNLASNAVQHGTRGEPISLRVTGDADRVTIAVHNEGVIPPEVLPHIFDPFRSAHDDQRRGGGLGLGLFIADAIAHAHGGTIHVTSTPEQGTTFELTLPRSPGPISLRATP